MMQTSLGMESMRQQQANIYEMAAQQRAVQLMSRIYVGSLAFDLTAENVTAAFSPFGSMQTVSLAWDAVTMKHKGFSFVEYEVCYALSPLSRALTPLSRYRKLRNWQLTT